MQEFQGNVIAGKFSLPDHIRPLRAQYLASLPEGCAVSEKLDRIGTPRTNQQLRAFFGMVISAAKMRFDELGIDCMGVPLSQDMVKDVLYKYCGGVGDHGETLRLSKPMSTIQAAQFFDNCRTWLATFGVVIPDPDPAWKKSAESSEPAENAQEEPPADPTPTPASTVQEPPAAYKKPEPGVYTCTICGWTGDKLMRDKACPNCRKRDGVDSTEDIEERRIAEKLKQETTPTQPKQGKCTNQKCPDGQKGHARPWRNGECVKCCSELVPV